MTSFFVNERWYPRRDQIQTYVIFFRLAAFGRFQQSFCTVLDHSLKIWAIICLGRHGAVNISAENSDLIFVCKCFAVPQLTLNGFLALIVGKIAGIDDPGHFFSSIICIISSLIRFFALADSITTFLTTFAQNSPKRQQKKEGHTLRKPA